MDESYRKALDSLDRLAARDDGRIAERGRTIALLHAGRTDRSVLLLHGLTASPGQFADIASDLYAGGANVVVPRFPRHGYADRLTLATAYLTGDELRAGALEGLEIVRGLGERVIVAGFSLGGLMAAWLAQHEEMDLAVPIAPFFGIAGLSDRFAAGLARWTLRRRNVFLWWDLLKRERQLPAHGYPRYPTHALARALLVGRELYDEACASAPRAKRMVVVTNARESSVNNRAIRRFVERWRERAAGRVETYSVEGLPYSHDVIEPLRSPSLAARVKPQLLNLMGVHS